MTSRLEGKAGIVTGAGAGLGRAVLLAATRAGARIVAFEIDPEAGESAVEEARAAGGAAIFHQGDVRVEDDWAAAIRRCVDEFGAFDVLDNNAGVAIEKRLHDTSLEDWDTVNAVNLRGTFLGCKYGVIAMRGRGGGSIVNTGSIVSLTGDPILPAYATTKTGIVGLTRVIAVDYAEDGIRCNCICPGDMDTPMLQRSFSRAPDPAAMRREMEAAYPLRRIADPAEIANAVIFLLSDESSFVTGSLLVADGGLTAKCY